jgi:CRP-like cAMP-binding protein
LDIINEVAYILGMATAVHPPQVSVSLSVVSAKDCPLYAPGDRFSLDGQVLTLPASKRTCLILADDIRRHLVAGPDVALGKESPTAAICCGGCEGKIGLAATRVPPEDGDPEKLRRMEKLVRTLGHYSLFKTLDENELRSILPDLKVVHVNTGDIIIRQGHEGRHLHIILEGSVDVLATDRNILLATLGQGEVFGEMSLLSGNVCTASIRAREACRILTLDGNLFRDMVQRYPSMQRYVFQLLAHRLRSTNLLKETQLAQGVHGSLVDLSLPELLQALNISKKSGLLSLISARGTGTIAMKDGEVVDALYLGGKGSVAFFEMLTETNGAFAYLPTLPPETERLRPLGEFMNLLMEGFVRSDESRQMLGSSGSNQG